MYYSHTYKHVGNMTYYVTNMDTSFSGRLFNENIGSWDVSNATTMANMFSDNATFNQIIGSWNVSNVLDMISMFYNVSLFNQDIGSWTVLNISNVISMFSNAPLFNQNIGIVECIIYG